LGSRGIEFKPVSVPTERSPEPIEKVIRDGARAVLCNGHTGSTLTKKAGSVHGSAFISSISNKLTITPAIGIARKFPVTLPL